MKELKSSEHEDSLKELEVKTTTTPDRFTVVGYGNLNGWYEFKIKRRSIN